ncbi:PAS domain-containing protein [Methanobacterium sp. MBAC-LM]|uniref:PAS domain-containing protein n=1 Tax=Methanobacterium sp. MBAC-LM TaxID=3412034 RepID=UPI003C722D46
MIRAGNYSFGETFEIFDNLLEGVSVYEPVYDDRGKIHDFIVKYVNFAAIAGSGNSCKYYIDKYISNLYGADALELHFKMYEDLIVTAKSKIFKAYLPPLNRYYQISGFSTSDGLFVLLGVDITDHEKIGRDLNSTSDTLKIEDQKKELNNELKSEIKDGNIKKILKENGEKFRLIFNRADDMISLNLMNEDGTPGKFIEINDTGIKRLGYNKEEFLNMTPYDIDKEYETRRALAKPTKEHHATFETVHTTKDSQRIPVEITAHIINYNGKNVGLSISRDISERKKAEDSLKESESRYRKLLENCFDAVVFHSEGKVIWANNTAMELLGVKNSEKLVNMSLIDFVHPDYREIVIERMNNMVENKAVPPIEEKFLAIGGKVIDVEVLAAGFTYNKKNAVQVVFRDISKRKETEKALKDFAILQAKIMRALKESEEKFRLIFNNANDMISLSEIDANGMPGKYIEINEVGVERLGYAKEELLNMSPVDIVAPDKRAEMPFNAVALTKNGYSNFEIVHITKDGRRIPVEVNGHTIKYKGRKVYLTVCRDITRHKLLVNALKESEEKFREIFHNANDMITLHKMNENGMPGKFIEVNEVGCNRLGYTNEEFQNMSPVDIVAPDKRVEMASHAIEIWTNGYAKFEIVHIAKDGKRIPVEINTHIFKFRGETVALGISRDITERKDAEEKLKKLLNKLSYLNEESEQFIYTTANYLQEHLEMITDITKQLKNDYKDKLDVNIENSINCIADESDHLKQMILNLLE